MKKMTMGFKKYLHDWLAEYGLTLLLIAFLIMFFTLCYAWHTGLLFPGPWVLIHLNNSTI